MRRPSPTGRPTGGRRAVESAVRVVSSLSPRAALPLVVVGALVIAAGLAVEGGLTIQTDPERWIDQDGRAVTDLSGADMAAMLFFAIWTATILRGLSAWLTAPDEQRA